MTLSLWCAESRRASGHSQAERYRPGTTIVSPCDGLVVRTAGRRKPLSVRRRRATGPAQGAHQGRDGDVRLVVGKCNGRSLVPPNKPTSDALSETSAAEPGKSHTQKGRDHGELTRAAGNRHRCRTGGDVSVDARDGRCRLGPRFDLLRTKSLRRSLWHQSNSTREAPFFRRASIVLAIGRAAT